MVVLVQDVAEAFTSSYSQVRDLLWIGDWHRCGAQAASVREALVRPMGVIEVFELPQGMAEMVLVPDARRTR
ncbi:hypothetical protein GCM10010431_20770 [Streptomyces kunmingensis]